MTIHKLKSKPCNMSGFIFSITFFKDSYVASLTRHKQQQYKTLHQTNSKPRSILKDDRILSQNIFPPEIFHD